MIMRLARRANGSPSFAQHLAIRAGRRRRLLRALNIQTFIFSTLMNGLALSSAASWARIVAQSVYYATVQSKLDAKLRFIVPSGNMGDALAGYVAAKCGLIRESWTCVCAVNENDALARILGEGEMKRTPAVSTPSPAMDISVPSNFERVLFEACGRDADFVRETYASYAQTGDVALPQDIVSKFSEMGFAAERVTNAETMTEMQRVLDATGWLVCPHTAVGTAAARRRVRKDVASVVLATAHAAKFPETVKDATGQDASLPARCGDIENRAEIFAKMPNDASVVAAHVRSVQAMRGS